MSSESLNQKQSNKSLSKKNKTKRNAALNSKTNVPISQTEASTSNSEPESSKNENKEGWKGYLPQSMWFWKPPESKKEVQLNNRTLISKPSGAHGIVLTSQHSFIRNTESEYIWPDVNQNLEPEDLGNQPILNQIIEQTQLREQEFNKHVDYLGDKVSQSKLTILFDQLNELLPSTSQKVIESNTKLKKSKPLQVNESKSQQIRRNTSKVSENLTPEETAEREKLRQNQLKEYDNLRNQIGLFGEKISPIQLNMPGSASRENIEETLEEIISKTDLDELVDLLNDIPNMSEENENKLKKFIKSKPTIEAFLRRFHRKVSPETDRIRRQNQLQEFEQIRDQIALHEDRFEPKEYTTTETTIKKTKNVIKETISKTKLKHLFSLITEQKQGPSKIKQHLTPEERERQEELRQHQIDEYENLREHIGLFGKTQSERNMILQVRKEFYVEEKKSKRELNGFINQLDKISRNSKTTEKDFPYKYFDRKITERSESENRVPDQKFRMNQIQEFENLCKKMDVFGEERSTI